MKMLHSGNNMMESHQILCVDSVNLQLSKNYDTYIESLSKSRALNSTNTQNLYSNLINVHSHFPPLCVSVPVWQRGTHGHHAVSEPWPEHRHDQEQGASRCR